LFREFGIIILELFRKFQIIFLFYFSASEKWISHVSHRKFVKFFTGISWLIQLLN
jgi:hypothetical protein